MSPQRDHEELARAHYGLGASTDSRRRDIRVRDAPWEENQDKSEADEQTMRRWNKRLVASERQKEARSGTTIRTENR